MPKSRRSPCDAQNHGTQSPVHKVRRAKRCPSHNPEKAHRAEYLLIKTWLVIADVSESTTKIRDSPGFNDRTAAVTVRHVTARNHQATTAPKPSCRADPHQPRITLAAHLEQRRLAGFRTRQASSPVENATPMVGGTQGAGNNISACTLDQVGDDHRWCVALRKSISGRGRGYADRT